MLSYLNKNQTNPQEWGEQNRVFWAGTAQTYIGSSSRAAPLCLLAIGAFEHYTMADYWGENTL